MSELDAMKAISDALESLESEEQIRVLIWAQSKFGGASPVTTPPATPAGTMHKAVANSPAAPKAKQSKKAKSVISMDKSLNLSPQGKKSAEQFATEKAPSNVKEKCVVAVYYLRDVIDLPNVTVQSVFTFFKHVQWPTPTDMKNTLQQAGTDGWLDTAKSEDIKLTSSGENLVEHKLPPNKTKVKA